MSRPGHPADRQHGARSGPGETRGSRILIIEDDPALVASLSVRLKRGGHQVVAEHDGAAGLRSVQRERPDVVLLDLGLPGMRGFKVLHELRELLACPRVIVMTGDQEMELSRLANYGVRALFHKPFDVAELLDELGRPT